jgi:hypothetical protein
MGMAEILEELAKAYIDGMPLDTIKDKIKDIVTTCYRDNSFTVYIYLANDNINYTHILILVNLNNIPSFCIHSNYIGRAIGEIVNYFKLLGFKEVK